MQLHGSTKLIAIWLLWRKKKWSYPLTVIVFGVFIAYEIYSYLNSYSIPVLVVIIGAFIYNANNEYKINSNFIAIPLQFNPNDSSTTYIL